MRIVVWGLGYVGTVSAACFAQLGHEVVGVEPKLWKVQTLNSGHSPIEEPGLETLVNQVVEAGRLKAVQDGMPWVAWADLSMICVGTPTYPDGKFCLSHLQNAAIDLGHGLHDLKSYHVVVLRSTVFPGTTDGFLRPILEKHSGLKEGDGFGLIVNPEFLREGNAIADFHAPPYVLIGESNKRAGDVLEQLYRDINAPVYRRPFAEAELLKLVNNAFHALKIGFANEVGRLCSCLGIDGQALMRLVCADSKLNISAAYLEPGFAFGGSCLPKDLRSLSHNAHQLGVRLPIVEAILPSNRVQIETACLKVHESGAHRVGVLGLSFKPGTDDLRESPALSLVRELWQDGFDVLVHDPNVRLDRMLGANREYLERQLPQIAQILRLDITEILGCQLVVVTQKREEFLSALGGLDGETKVLDLTGVINGSPSMTLATPAGHRARA